MKTLLTIFLAITTSVWAKPLTFTPAKNKNYVRAVVSEIPSFQTTTKEQATKYIPVVQNIAADLKVSPALLISVIWTESHFKADARSNVGAKGLMQIMPKTRRSLIKEMKNFNLIVTKYLHTGLTYSELEDLILGAYYLNKLNTRFQNTEHAIIAYNMGPTWVAKKLARNEVVGNKNDYLNKVKNKIMIIAAAE